MAGEMDILSGIGTGAAAGSVVPGIGTAVGAGIGLLGGLFSFFGKKAAADRMREEQLRKFDLAAQQRLGLAEAQGAASGVEFNSSTIQKHLAAMQKEFATARRSIEEGYSNINSAAGIGLAGDFAGTAFSFAKQNNWWQGGGGSPSLGFTAADFSPGGSHEGWT